MAASKKWKKILYEKQDFPDNYVDPEQFLKELKNNLYTQTYTLRQVVIASTVVTQETSSVFSFVGVFWYLEEERLTAIQLFAVCLVLAVLLLTVWVALLGCKNFSPIEQLSQWLQPAVLFLLFLCGTSPILKTLTESISTDTIWAMTVAMMLGHLLFHCYDDTNRMTTGAVSLNAAIFAAVCLASRLPTSLHAFVTVLFAVLLFGLLPRLRMFLQKTSQSTNTVVTFGVIVPLTLFTLSPVSPPTFLFYFLSVSAISFVCPFWFTKLQRLKNTIHGPWDEAAINIQEN